MTEPSADIRKELEATINNNAHDAGTTALAFLQKNDPINAEDNEHQLWLDAGHAFHNSQRWREALLIHWTHYQALLSGQAKSGERKHKGSVLVLLSDCFYGIGFPVHGKRYLMLALCEDAVTQRGNVPTTVGAYFRLLSMGMTQNDFKRYSQALFEISEENKDERGFPEALLQGLGDDSDWLTEFPSPIEVSFFRINPFFVRYLLDKIPDRSGRTLERLAGYLMSCMAGCRTRSIRLNTDTTEYDVVCAMEGLELDFRSEFGRYFICECKDLDGPADFTTMAKFARVLDATKSRFGVLFSVGPRAITGRGKRKNAEAEQINFFHASGKVIVVVDRKDLDDVVEGANLIALLRNRYEKVRLGITEGLDPAASTRTSARRSPLPRRGVKAVPPKKDPPAE